MVTSSPYDCDPCVRLPVRPGRADMSDTTQDLEQWDPNEDDTIIVPLEDDYALVVGPNTKGLEKIDGSLVGDRALNDLIASIGEGASLSGGAASAANAMQHMSGLYKLDAVTKAQLAAGNALTKATDGRLIGTVRNAGGQITRQARLIPVSAPQIAGAIAAIGPAVAMVAVQIQLNNISKQVSAVQQTTLQTKRILEDWHNADFQGTRQVVLRISHKSTEEGIISNTNWEQISGLSNVIEKHRNYYKVRIQRHIQELRGSQNDVSARRNYITEHQESILFDSLAAFNCIQTWFCYFQLAHERARMEGEQPTLTPDEIRTEVEDDLAVQRKLLHALMRELHIIAELPGGWTAPASGKKKEAHLSTTMAKEIIEALELLAHQLGIKENPAPTPDVTCGPDDYDTSPYTKILHWYLDEGEELKALTFPVNRLSHGLLAKAPAQFASTVNNLAWLLLPHAKDSTDWSLGWFGRKAGQTIAVAPEMVAVTDRRIITANPQEFIQKGFVTDKFTIDDVGPTFIDPDADNALPELHLTQGGKKYREWCFPSEARTEARKIAELLVEDPAQLLPPANPELDSSQINEIAAADPMGDSCRDNEPVQARPEAPPEPGTEEASATPTA